MQNVKTKAFFSADKVIIQNVEKNSELSHLMFPVLEELKTAYNSKLKYHASWIAASVNEVAKLIDELDNKTGNALECEIMKRATYLIEFELWITVMELLVYDNKEI